MPLINVEHYEHSTFQRWTDGPKYVLDLMAFPFLLNKSDLVTYIYCDGISDVETFLFAHPHRVGTFYVCSSLLNFLKIKYPDHLDVRLLMV